MDKKKNGCCNEPIGCNCNPGPDINMYAGDCNMNMLPMLQTYTTKVLKPHINGCGCNVLLQKYINCPEHKYVIKWDFDLCGQSIVVPKNCILEFDGGSLKNGTITGQDTLFINVGDVEIWGENLTRLGTWREKNTAVDDHLDSESTNPVQNKVITAYIESLQHQIDELNAMLAGVVLTVQPQSIPMARTNIGITVTAATEISSVVVYRGDTEIGRSETPGRTFSFTDDVTPQSTDNIVYRAEVTVSGIVITKEAIVTVTDVQRLNVFVGHGADYAGAQFTDTGRSISNNMIVSVNRNAGDYVFIKVDKRDTVNNLYTYPGPNMEEFEYVVALDSPVVDGDYKYYKTTNRYNAGEIQYKINKV